MTKEDLARFDCVDCGVSTFDNDEYYMVHDRVWEGEAGMKKDGGMLCIGCLENRIGRSLVSTDFTAAPLNSMLGWHSTRLLERLGRGG